MRYQLRKGIVKTQICGVQMLLCTRAAAGDGPPVRHLNLLESFCVEACVKQMPEENLEKAFQILTKKEDAEIKQMISDICGKLVEETWLVENEA